MKLDKHEEKTLNTAIDLYKEGIIDESILKTLIADIYGSYIENTVDNFLNNNLEEYTSKILKHQDNIYGRR